MYLPVFVTLILSFVTKLIICNEKPVIGILTQEIQWSSFKNVRPSNYSYIAASYVKAIEASGGRVVPVFTNRTTEYYKDVVKKVNGILVPGGGSLFNISFGISQSTYEIFHIAKDIFRHKKYSSSVISSSCNVGHQESCCANRDMCFSALQKDNEDIIEVDRQSLGSQDRGGFPPTPPPPPPYHRGDIQHCHSRRY